MGNIAKDFKQLARFHLESAERLFLYIKEKEPEGISYFPCDLVIYIAGYAIEIILKAKIAQNHSTNNADDFEKNVRKKIKIAGQKIGGENGHDLEILLNQTGLKSGFMTEMPIKGVAWDFIRDKWRPNMRYEISDFYFTKTDARLFIQDVKIIVDFFEKQLDAQTPIETPSTN